jgi:hypothetical protein
MPINSITLLDLPQDVFNNIFPWLNSKTLKNFNLISKNANQKYKTYKKSQFEQYASALSQLTNIKWDAHEYSIEKNGTIINRYRLQANKDQQDNFEKILTAKKITNHIWVNESEQHIYIDRIFDIELILASNSEQLLAKSCYEAAIKLLNTDNQFNCELYETDVDNFYFIQIFSEAKDNFGPGEIEKFKTEIIDILSIPGNYIAFNKHETRDNKVLFSAIIAHPIAIKCILEQEPIERLKNVAAKLIKELYELVSDKDKAKQLIEIAKQQNIASILSTLNPEIIALDPTYNYEPNHPLRCIVLTLHALFNGKDISLTHAIWQAINIDKNEQMIILGQGLLDALSSLENRLTAVAATSPTTTMRLAQG